MTTPEPVRKMIAAKAVLAPMSGVTDVPFRMMARKYGCRFAFTEMIDVNAIVYKNRKSFRLLDKAEGEGPLGVQIVGQGDDKILAVARFCEDMGFEIIDLNAGCPARKVVKGGKGSAMMKDPKALAIVVGKLVKSLKIPVTVKIRSGWDSDSLNYLEVSKAVAGEGASAICIHPRTKEQMYSGKPDYDAIRQVKENVEIPVFASGNIFSPEDAGKVMKETACDGVFVARGALGRPWIFSSLRDYFATGEVKDNSAGFEFIKTVMAEHFDMNADHFGEYMGIRRMYKHLCWYMKKMKNLDNIMAEFRKLESRDGVKDFISRLSADGNRLFLGT